MTRITFEIPGKPFAKQRHRVSFQQRRTFNTTGNVSFERQVGQIALPHFPQPLDGPVSIEIIAVFEPPQSWSKRKVEYHLHHPHTQKPDADNCAKSVLDGLNRIAFSDDKQIAEITVRKVWGVDAKTVVHVEAM